MPLQPTQIVQLICASFRANDLHERALLCARPTREIADERKHEREIIEGAPFICTP